MTSTTDPPQTPQALDGAVENAWRIHGALVDWTGKVDSKAAFALSIESVALAGAVALAKGREVLNISEPLPSWPLWLGGVLLAVAALLSMGVVLPRMKALRANQDWPSNFIYFGHLRHWSPERLAEALRTTDPLPALSRQLVVMSQVAWRKHRLVQLSFGAAAAGITILAAALVGR
ncbi:Pycsar system effector family protein [Streptomyces sp. NPDC041068]|uniref:Pycsar system effector family protein n=1 Tax=Streptomyces sp. NPDC041068 TaxID=3155130 RepID=UPI0033FCB399